MATTMTKLLTAADLLRLSGEGVHGELIRGVLYEAMPSGYAHSKIAANLTILLGSFIKPRRLGSLATSESSRARSTSAPTRCPMVETRLISCCECSWRA